MNVEILKKIKNDLSIKTHNTPYKWTRELNGVSKKAAKKLEKITGINRLRFLYPDEFGPPWDELESFYKNE